MGAEVSVPNYAYIVPNSAKPERGCGPIYRSALAKDGPISYADKSVLTIYDNFRRGLELNPRGNCLGKRVISADGTAGPYVWETYASVYQSIEHFGSGLRNLGLEPGSFLGVYSINRPEYLIAEQACYTQSMGIIALYDTLGAEAVAYILNHSQLSTILCSQDKILKLLSIAPNCPTMKTIIQIEPKGDQALITKAEELGIRLLSFNEVKDNGAFKPHEHVPPKPESLASVMYTSGTTGLPKGVMLTHANIIGSTACGDLIGLDIRFDDIHISYLPMAHIFERAIQTVVLGKGGAVGFFQGSVDKLFDDISTLAPTIFVSVPRLYNRIYDKVTQTVERTGGLKKVLYDYAFSSKKSSMKGGQDPSSVIWDNLVFSNMKGKLGGKVRLCITGSAPITQDVHEFLTICFCCPVLQGYGLTETSAAGTLSYPSDITIGHVGGPLPCCEIRLQDVPDMKYFSDDQPYPRGEVCLRGSNVTPGYLNDEQKTKEAFDEDGFFHTGDVGQWLPNGSLQIIDRIKNIFKLAHGEYVAAEYLEGIFTKNRFVGQIFVYGDSLKSCLVAVIVPDPDVIIPWAKANGIDNSADLAAICASEKVNKVVLEELSATGKEAKINGFEHIRGVYLEANPFTTENELITPTFKLMRPKLKDRYKEIIDELYAKIPEAPPR